MHVPHLIVGPPLAAAGLLAGGEAQLGRVERPLRHHRRVLALELLEAKLLLDIQGERGWDDEGQGEENGEVWKLHLQIDFSSKIGKTHG